MIFSVLFDTLPEFVDIDGIRYRIGYGYRTMMAIEIEMFSDHNDEQKLLNALNLFYLNNIPGNREKAVERMLWFHRCGNEDRKEEKKEKRPLKKVGRSYCFEQDAPLFYAAFRQQYNINLRSIKNCDLHWWEFSALFAALDDDTKLAKVMYWRTCRLSDIPAEKRKYIQEMKKLYELRRPDSSLDSQARLVKRNTEMLEYVRKRMEECRKG